MKKSFLAYKMVVFAMPNRQFSFNQKYPTSLSSKYIQYYSVQISSQSDNCSSNYNVSKFEKSHPEKNAFNDLTEGCLSGSIRDTALKWLFLKV